MSKEKVLISVIAGVEGNSLSVGNKTGGTRLAGNKPWGGGRIIHSFEVDVEELIKTVEQSKYEKEI